MIVAEKPVVATRRASLFGLFDQRLRTLLRRGGPAPGDYGGLQLLLKEVGEAVRDGSIARDEFADYVQEMTRTHLGGTLQAAALARKYGYSGDFEIIDDIYTLRTSLEPNLRRWDLFFHAQAAPCAVRNRKTYFHQILEAQLARRGGRGPMEVLNVASGPGRDLREWFQEHPEEPVHFDCVEMEARAIEYAGALCAPWQGNIQFHHRNVLRCLPARGYDLVWSAGLFDYLSDRLFVHLLKALLAVTKSRGEVVIGNFSDYNPSRDYMELLGHWHLHHRSHESLIALAGQAGASPDMVQVFWEPQGVNHFLHVRR